MEKGIVEKTDQESEDIELYKYFGLPYMSWVAYFSRHWYFDFAGISIKFEGTRRILFSVHDVTLNRILG